MREQKESQGGFGRFAATQLKGIIFGLCITGLLSFGAWVLAYYGYINLGLPQRYDFEKLDHAVKQYIPKDYTYASRTLDNFRQADTKSIMIIATPVGFPGPPDEDTPDILLIFDKTDREYKLSYRFQPTFDKNDKRASPLHVNVLQTYDVSGDSRPDITIGWSEMGAHWAPPLLTVFTGENHTTRVMGQSTKLHNFTYPKDYQFTTLTNSFNSAEKINTDRSDILHVKQGQIAIMKRSDDACNACGEEHIYSVNLLSVYSDRLVEAGSPLVGVKSYDKLQELLSSAGYEVPKIMRQ